MSFLIPLNNRGMRYAAGIAAITAIGILIGQLGAAGAMSQRAAAGNLVMLASIVALGGFIACRYASARPGANDRRVWRLFGWGLLCWSLGGPLYMVFLLSGGDITASPFWTQLGFLAAYPFWYRALWLLRQPTVASGRLRRIEAGALEASAVLTIILLVGALLWRGDLNVSENLAQLTPVTLDLLLGAALYNAARRTVLSRSTAYVWFLAGFASLALTDAMVSLNLSTDQPWRIAVALSLYPLPLGLLAWASTRGLEVIDGRRDLSNSHLALGMVSLVLIGPAASLTPPAWHIGWWALAGLIVWRLAANFFRRSDQEGDVLTGVLDARGFERYLEGLSLGASDDQPAAVVGVDMNGFAAWTQRNGFAAGDGLLIEVAGLLGSRPEFANGAWGRLGADLFVWAGVGTDFDDTRVLAELAAATASDNRSVVSARASFVLMPRDAQSVTDAISALQEGLSVAGQAGVSAVAFDRGELDGFEAEGGYTASLRRRRERVEAVLADEQSIVSFVQPIVDLAEGRVVGHEALSRFQGEPRRGPDVWIAEANAVGLGTELEAACLARALERRDEMPAGTYLSVNASGELLSSPLFEQVVGGEGDLSWLVIEITEHEKIDDYPALNARLTSYRMRGARVAIDDAGAGHSSMHHIIKLRPDLVKLDRSLIGGIQDSEGQQAMVGSLVSFTTKTGAKLVAEGVETDQELEVLRSLCVPLGQGYGIGRPGPEFRAGQVIGVSPHAPVVAGA